METTNTNGVITAATTARPPKKASPANIMGNILNAESTKKLLTDTLKENAGAFTASIIDLYNTDTYLQQCDPKLVFGECLKAASLKLPINKQLGFSYIVPYKGIPQFQIGYKGLIQLALRTGAYRHINAGTVYENELKRVDKLTGEVDISGEKISDKVIGYFAYIETTNGFKKCMYWPKNELIKHATKYSKSYSSANSVWKSDFDAMAKKTMLRNLLSHYGYMSIEMANALDAEDNAKIAGEVMADDTGEEPVIEVQATTSESATDEI